MVLNEGPSTKLEDASEHQGDVENPISVEFNPLLGLRAIGALTFDEYLSQPFVRPQLLPGQTIEQKMEEERKLIFECAPHLSKKAKYVNRNAFCTPISMG